MRSLLILCVGVCVACSGVYGRSVSDNRQDDDMPGAVASKTGGVPTQVEDLTRVKRGWLTTILKVVEVILEEPKVKKVVQTTMQKITGGFVNEVMSKVKKEDHEVITRIIASLMQKK